MQIDIEPSRIVKSYLKVKPLVKRLLKNIPETKNSDKRLFWEYFRYMGLLIKETKETEVMIVTKDEWMKLHELESVTRARRKIQENNPDLDSDADIKYGRELSEDAMRHEILEENRMRYDF